MKVCPFCKKEVKEKGIATHIWRSHGNGKSHNPNINRIAWNKGLTKETDNRIKKQAEELKKKIKLGLIKTSLGQKRSEETKKKLSKQLS